MGWPIESDYFEAVQNPQTCFSDPELKSGKPALTPLGLPKPITGAFASVYEVTTSTKRWAVRCFLREFADQQTRYEAISEHLKKSNLPYTVAFEFQRQGIRIRGTWYPILKMEWIEGETLGAYIERNVSNPNALAQLSRDWVQMVAALQKAGIAHGDLQHGNIIVGPSGIRLIDYDGMFVPALLGRISHEEGHRNYQHPGRASHDFDAQIDNFSAWVIFVSLTALFLEPRLWKAANGGDECLLFRRADFQRPDQSQVFALLRQSTRPELQGLAAHFQSILHLPVRRVPPLDPSTTTSARPGSTSAPTQRGGGHRPSWLDDHVPPEAPPTEGLLQPDVDAPAPADTTPSAAWIIDHLVDQTPEPSAVTKRSLRLEHTCVIVLALLWFSGLVLAEFGTLIGGFLLLAAFLASGAFAVLLHTRYESFGDAEKRLEASKRLRNATDAATQAEKAIIICKNLWRTTNEPLIKLDAHYRAVSQQVTTKLDKLLRSYNATIESLNNERSSLALREKQEATAIDERTNKELARLAKQRVEIDRAENDEVIRLGKDMAENYVLYALQNAHIASARIDGFGVKMKAKLAAYGVTSAADIDNRVFRIPGIKSGKASSLFTWRGWIEQQARMEAPSPAPSAVSHVKMKYEAARTTNMQQTMAVRTRENDDRQLLMRNFGRYHAENARRTTEAEQTYEASRRRIVTDGDHTKADLKKQFEILSKRLQGERERYNQELTNLNQKLFRAKLEVTSAQRAVDRIGFVSFSSYVKATFRLKRSA